MCSATGAYDKPSIDRVSQMAPFLNGGEEISSVRGGQSLPGRLTGSAYRTGLLVRKWLSGARRPRPGWADLTAADAHMMTTLTVQRASHGRDAIPWKRIRYRAYGVSKYFTFQHQPDP